MRSHTLIRLESDNTLWSWHLDGGICSMEDRHELDEERHPHDTVVLYIETGHLKGQHLLELISP
jgi:hypothetical protein